jgi:spore germination protein GerM
LLSAGCGVPTSADARSIPANQVPANLLSPTPPATTTTQPGSYVSVPVFLIGGAPERLVSVARDIVVSAQSSTYLTEVLTALVSGPTTADSAAGLFSAIPLQTRVLSVSVAAGVATVNFNSVFATLSGAAQSEAVAQVVFTLTAQPNVTSVAFQIEGQVAAVPVGSGAVVSTPVTPAQFPNLAPTH